MNPCESARQRAAEQLTELLGGHSDDRNLETTLADLVTASISSPPTPRVNTAPREPGNPARGERSASPRGDAR